jgi:transcriptional regulator with XRE-family HTH domain
MDTELAKTIGAAARAARTAHGLSQADAAERVGISTEFYARIERGGTLPSTPTLLAIAEALDVSADVLLGRASRSGRRAALRAFTEDDGLELPRDLRLLLRRARRARPKTIRLLNLLAAALAEHG